MKIREYKSGIVKKEKRKLSKFLSPSCINNFYSNKIQWYQNYVLRRERCPQSAAMGLGSGFDAFVKSAINTRIANCVFPFDNLQHCYNEQVSDRLDLFAVSEKVFNDYVKAGMLNRILHSPIHGHLQRAVMEVLTTTVVNGITIGGYPDALLTYEDGAQVILDWKVNGYFSGRRIAIGPEPHYVTGDTTGRERQVLRTDFAVTPWNTQLGIYSLCTGYTIGVIHQLAFNGIDKCRYAEFYGTVNTNGLVEKVEEVYGELINDCPSMDANEKLYASLC